MKEETLEEAISRTKEEYTFLFNEEFFELCAKWQQEQDKKLYSEEEVYKLMDEYQDWLIKTNEAVKTFKEWFEQIKKK